MQKYLRPQKEKRKRPKNSKQRSRYHVKRHQLTSKIAILSGTKGPAGLKKKLYSAAQARFVLSCFQISTASIFYTLSPFTQASTPEEQWATCTSWIVKPLVSEPTLAKLKGQDGVPLQSLRGQYDRSRKIYYILWDNVETAFTEVDHLRLFVTLSYRNIARFNLSPLLICKAPARQNMSPLFSTGESLPLAHQQS